MKTGTKVMLVELAVAVCFEALRFALVKRLESKVK